MEQRASPALDPQGGVGGLRFSSFRAGGACGGRKCRFVRGSVSSPEIIPGCKAVLMIGGERAVGFDLLDAWVNAEEVSIMQAGTQPVSKVGVGGGGRGETKSAAFSFDSPCPQAHGGSYILFTFAFVYYLARPPSTTAFRLARSCSWSRTGPMRRRLQQASAFPNCSCLWVLRIMRRPVRAILS